jgi:hypothetical protein
VYIEAFRRTSLWVFVGQGAWEQHHAHVEACHIMIYIYTHIPARIQTHTCIVSFVHTYGCWVKEGWDGLFIFLRDMLLKYIVRDRDRDMIDTPLLRFNKLPRHIHEAFKRWHNVNRCMRLCIPRIHASLPCSSQYTQNFDKT